MISTTKIAIGLALFGAAALGALSVSYPAAQQADAGAPAVQSTGNVNTSFSDEEENDIRTLVHDYLMNNPEVIIEAVNRYSAQQREMAETRSVDIVREEMDALLDPANGYVAGATGDDAKIAVVEFFDYHCGFCKRAAPVVNDLIKKEDDIAVIFRELPILRQESEYAAEIALAAREQDAFLDMHFAMMEAKGVLTKEHVAKIAKENGVDFDQLEADRNAPKVPAAIVGAVDLAQAMGIDGTPAFIVASTDGKYVNVVRGFDQDGLKRAIKEARAAKG